MPHEANIVKLDKPLENHFPVWSTKITEQSTEGRKLVIKKEEYDRAEEFTKHEKKQRKASGFYRDSHHQTVEIK